MIEFSNYIAPVILGICLCIGFVFQCIEIYPNKYIPFAMAILGVFISVWVQEWHINPEIVLTGLVSGLASCGMYDALKTFIYKE